MSVPSFDKSAHRHVDKSAHRHVDKSAHRHVDKSAHRHERPLIRQYDLTDPDKVLNVLPGAPLAWKFKKSCQ
ncbi:hypothetical protein DUNSADRAFT_811 [Dunaliella salina]|uniref:Encoded protein n=1 Tax=Dunaliella salina TaxID=3046 RepID=A0ABQ7GXT3_DUNSA|nr:hypothetical protein DUNSADRAFT_811 [Dunaliella salina]|eukprot:KAF5839409.1 hypothetical protein DUNSADRAFT_811 [Dunaliella salina]